VCFCRALVRLRNQSSLRATAGKREGNEHTCAAASATPQFTHEFAPLSYTAEGAASVAGSTASLDTNFRPSVRESVYAGWWSPARVLICGWLTAVRGAHTPATLAAQPATTSLPTPYTIFLSPLVSLDLPASCGKNCPVAG